MYNRRRSLRALDVIRSESLQRRKLGFQRLNQLSVLQIITSCPLFVAGVVTLVMALPHVKYPVFNIGPVIVAILVFPMALIGLLATRKATENLDLIQITGVVKYMIVCNFLLSLLCSVLAAVSSFYSFLVVEQCSHINSKYYELCLPNSRTNIGLSVVDGVVCLLLFMLSVLGISHFSQYGSKLCFNTDEEVPVRKVVPLALVLPGQSYGQG